MNFRILSIVLLILHTFSCIDSQVERAAYNHNLHMIRNNCFSHQCAGEPPMGQRLSNAGYVWSGVGEVLTAGHSDCNGAVNAWLNSEGHRKIILGSFRHLGCSGLICNHCSYRVYWTCVAANPR